MKEKPPRVGFLFYFTVVPIFIVLLVINIWAVDTYLPQLWDGFLEIQGSEGEAVLAWLLFTPLPILGGYLWYRLAMVLNSRFIKRRCPVCSYTSFGRHKIEGEATESKWRWICSGCGHEADEYPE